MIENDIRLERKNDEFQQNFQVGLPFIHTRDGGSYSRETDEWTSAGMPGESTVFRGQGRQGDFTHRIARLVQSG
jgi:hypothetical protein